jgi:hypothetical protein
MTDDAELLVALPLAVQLLIKTNPWLHATLLLRTLQLRRPGQVSLAFIRMLRLKCITGVSQKAKAEMQNDVPACGICSFCNRPATDSPP